MTYPEKGLMVELPPREDIKPHRYSQQASHHNIDHSKFTKKSLVRSRLDSERAVILRREYGFSREIIARALRLQFEREDDDFPSFTEFYLACVDVCRGLGIQPPLKGEKLHIPNSRAALVRQLLDDGTIIGEDTYTTSYGETSSAEQLCGHCNRNSAQVSVYPCWHRSLCNSCANIAVNCPSCDRRIEGISN